ncbi:MAG: hypothetical protein IJX88_00725 [Clostridia bacterium]|nr:hypothetical protein [Clostridia bacterium]
MQTLMKNTQAYKLLQAEKLSNKLAHAYLLLCDDTKNLRETAKLFAKPFFGCDGENLSQKQQRIAELIDEEHFSDCLFYPESGKKFVVEDADKLAEECALKPVEGNEKLFVITDFSDATPQAQNKLLKLLEEPPQGVYFLLGASSSFSVLQTVLSRVKKLEIQPFSAEELVPALNRIYSHTRTKEEIALCAACAGGSLGGAQNMLEGGAYKSLSEDAFSLALADGYNLPNLIKQAGETKRKKELLSLLRILFRDALLIKTEAEKGEKTKQRIFLKTERLNLMKIADKYSLRALVFAQEAISQAEQEVFFNAYFPQCLEILVSKIQNVK